MIVFLIMILQMTAFMGRIAVTTFYVIYCLGAFTLIALLMTIPSIGGALCSLAIVPLVKRFGKRNVLMVSLILQGIGLLVVYFADFDNLPMIIAGHVIFGLFNMGFPISLSLVADSVDYQELKSGVRTDGTAYATYGLATKIGNAIGASVGIMLLHSFGYRANMEQSMATKNGINLVVNLIPAILFFAAALACLLWNLSDKDTDDIRAQLDKKRENIND
jgi:GPH family glycoside/pentoside/hexuronide:cation symporter/probable glucitol transport protein GutA